MTRWILTLVACFISTAVLAQVTVPNTFVPGTVASASQVNANFEALGTNALNRSGGTITGTIAVDPGVTVDGVDISEIMGGNSIEIGKIDVIGPNMPQLVVGWDPSHVLEISVDQNGNASIGVSAPGAIITFTDPVKFGTITVDAINLGTINCTGCVGPVQLQDTSVGANTYGNNTTVPVFVVDADGRLTSVTNTPIAFPAGPPSYSTGPNQIPENAIIDQDLLARMASNDTIAGAWTFTQHVRMTGVIGPYFQSMNTDGRILLNVHSATNTFRVLPNPGPTGAYLELGGAAPGLAMILSVVGDNFGFVVAGPNGQTSFSQANAGGLILEFWPDKASHFWGDVVPSHDTMRTLGRADLRWKNINLDVPNNPTPALVVVNKGGAGTDKNSALGYIVGYASLGEQIKMMGSCRVSIRGGIITNVELC